MFWKSIIFISDDLFGMTLKVETTFGGILISPLLPVQIRNRVNPLCLFGFVEWENHYSVCGFWFLICPHAAEQSTICQIIQFTCDFLGTSKHTLTRFIWFLLRMRAFCCRNLKSITDREVCCFMISCKNSTNIDSVIDWLVKHSKSKNWEVYLLSCDVNLSVGVLWVLMAAFCVIGGVVWDLG